MTDFFRNWWVRELTSVLFKLHPLILLALNQLDSGETFLTLVISYLFMALFVTVRMVHTFGYDFVKIQLPRISSVLGKIGAGVGNFIGLTIVLVIHLFIYVLFFGLLLDAIQRPLYPNSVFDGPEGSIVVRTLVINGIWFFLIELLAFIKHVRTYSPTHHNVMAACFWGVDFTEMNRWRYMRIFWLIFFFMFFILMCSGFAFKVAIGSFFVFDIGFIIFRRLQLRSKSAQTQATTPAPDAARRRNA